MQYCDHQGILRGADRSARQHLRKAEGSIIQLAAKNGFNPGYQFRPEKNGRVPKEDRLIGLIILA